MSASESALAYASAADTRRPAGAPPVPRSLEETGLNFLFIVDLLLKILFLGGELRFNALCSRIRLPAAAVEPAIAFMRGERLCEVPRRGEIDTDIAYALTDLGRQRAEDALKKSQYAGPAPVSYESYVHRIESQSVRRMGVGRATLARIFEHVVIDPGLVDIFGAALNSGRAIFIHGPSGSGKTFVAEHLVEALSGHVYVPHALLVDGEVIQVFDPMIHRPVNHTAAKVASLDRAATHDARWMLCHRPVVQTGGELTLRMLDLDFDRATRFYNAPPQLKANNGLFIIDDLGRQLVEPRELMNRWIVPLDRRADYLALHTGTKFRIPFDVIVVFSSNLRPADLDDDAFMRRLGYKIHIGALDEGRYAQLVRQACAQYGVSFSEAALGYLLRECHRSEGRPLLAVVPWDIVAQIRDRAVYEEAEAVMTPESVRWAWNNYFAESGQ